MATRILTEQQIEGILLDVIDLFLIPKFNSLGMNATGEWENNLKPKGNAIWGRDYTTTKNVQQAWHLPYLTRLRKGVPHGIKKGGQI